MNDELNEDLEEYVDRLVRWRIRQRSRDLERALDNPSEVHVYDRPEAVVVAPASTKAAKGIAHEQRRQDEDEDDGRRTSRRPAAWAAQGVAACAGEQQRPPSGGPPMIRIGTAEMPLLDMLREQAPRARHATVAAMLRHGGLVDRAAIDRRIKQLVDAGLLTRAYAMCRPLPTLDAPLYTCNPAKERFAYDRAGELAWKLERRWTRGALERVRIYGPSAKLLGIYGGVTKPKIGNESQLSPRYYMRLYICSLPDHKPGVRQRHRERAPARHPEDRQENAHAGLRRRRLVGPRGHGDRDRRGIRQPPSPSPVRTSRKARASP